jgi:prepilin-type N-terminal cleavage/methylation domain-containing protein
MQPTKIKLARESGFTIIELLVVLMIIAVLFTLSTINLGQAQVTASLSSTTNTLLADLRSQQILAMSGDIGSTSTNQPQGVYITSNNYTLFAGNSYSGGDPNNFSVSTNSITLSTTFASNQVVFNKGDGSVTGFSSGNNSITLSSNGESKIITINRFGATSVN